MPTLYLTMRRPFDRVNIQVNDVLRGRIKDNIVNWTGWSGVSQSVEWKLRIHDVGVTDSDTVVYFVWNFLVGLVKRRGEQFVRENPQASNVTRDFSDWEREALAMPSPSIPPLGGGATFGGGQISPPDPNEPTVSEVWIRPGMAMAFQFRMNTPRWTEEKIDFLAHWFATAALHEAGHNKIEPAKRQSQRSWDLHVDGSGGIFGPRPAVRQQPTPGNLQLLRDHIAFEQRQLIVAHPAFE